MSQLRLRFGNYVHPDSEAAVTIDKAAVLNDQGIAWAIKETWLIQGRLEAETQVEMTTKIQALEAAYKKQPSEVALEFSNTGDDTAHRMSTSNLVSPIQVVSPPSYPQGFGAEYAGYRNYRIVVEGLTQTGIAQSGIVDWTESVSISGGYPRDVLVTTLNTLPIRQRVANHTPAIYTQYGSAASWNGFPIAPQFRFNVINQAVLLDNNVTKTTQAGTVPGTSAKVTIHRTSWSYAFALPTLVPLAGSIRPAAIPVTPV